MTQTHYSLKNKGFTLIELLIVIVIIGILATVAAVSLKNARIKSRDAKRVSDTKQIQGALEIYKMDEGTYPTTLTPGSPLTGPTSGITYMSKVPRNPSPRTDGSCTDIEYVYTPLLSGASYTMSYCIGSEVQGHTAGSYNITPTDAFASVVAGFSCGTDTVSYGGQTYNTVSIGTQCWLKENLNVGTMIGSKLADNITLQNQTNNSTIEKYCYTYIQQDNAGQITTGTADCAIYGGFYQWPEALQYNNGITLTSGDPAPGNIQGICPVGWHIPSDTEYSTLSTYLGGDSVSGGKMKGTTICGTNPCWNDPNTGATNSSGFTAWAAGYRDINGSFYDRGAYAEFWSTLPNGATIAWFRAPGYNNATLGRYMGNRADGFSVRCLKD